MKEMKELIQHIAEALVDTPEQVQVNCIEGENSIIIELKVAPDDVGKVIGKGGQTARALRVLLMAVSAKTDQRIGLEIVE